MGIIKNIIWNAKGAAVRRKTRKPEKTPWSLQTKIIAGVMAGVLVIGGSTGAVLLNHAGKSADKGLSVDVINPPTMAKVEVYEPTYVDIPNFIGMTVASDSLEKDLTLYFKGAESQSRIEGVSFQVKLLKSGDEKYLNEYLQAISDVNKALDDAKVDGTLNDPYEGELTDPTASVGSTTKVAGATHEKVTLTAAETKAEDKIAEQKNEAEQTIQANFDKLTIGEKLLLDKQIAIQSNATASAAVDAKTYVDDDGDGMIYIKKIDSGKYTACMVPTGFYDPAKYATEVTVKDKVEYKKVDNIKDKVKDASKVEDEKPADAAQVEAVLADTVAFVESSRTSIGGGFTEAKPAALATSVAGTNYDEKPFEKSARRGMNVLTALGNKLFGMSTVKAAELSVAESSITMKAGESKSVTVTATGTAVNNAVSSNDGVCKVTSYAADSVTLQAVSEGNATITVYGSTPEGGEAPAPKTITVTVEKNTTTVVAKLTVPQTVTLYGKSGLNTAKGTITAENLSGEVKAASNNGNVTATISGNEVTFTAKEGSDSYSATITYTATAGDGTTPLTTTTTVNVVGASTPIKDASGNVLYTDKDGKTAATVANYDANGKFFAKTGKEQFKYTGWQNIDGKTYYYTKDGVAVTGDQVIQGVQYSFNGLGVLVPKEGIDVSKWQGNIDWGTASSYINFAVIRCGYRGASSRGLAIDPKFSRNVQGAKANGVKIGLYFYSTATTEAEAVEEASLAVQCAQQAGGLSLPIYIDMEDGVQAGLSNDQRTAICNAFCATVRNSGYAAGVYANKNWLTNKINTGAISGAEIWVAQYNTTCTYAGSKKMWQYTSKGSVPGISGNVDMNRRY